MIAESAQVTFLSCIDEFAFAEGHKIEVLDPFVIILNHAASKLWLVDDFTNILPNETAGSNVSICSETITFLFGFDYRDCGVLLLLETLVLAAGAAPAISDTLHFCSPIDTVGIFSTGIVALGG